MIVLPESIKVRVLTLEQLRVIFVQRDTPLPPHLRVAMHALDPRTKIKTMLHLYCALRIRRAMLDKKERLLPRLPIVCVVLVAVDITKPKVTMKIRRVQFGRNAVLVKRERRHR